MPLLESRKLPKVRLSYRRELGQHMKVLLTGGAVALVLATVTLFGYFWGPIEIPGPDGPLLSLQLPPWAAVAGFLLMVCWVQYRMWADLRDKLHDVVAPLYRYHPQTDGGIDVRQVEIVRPVARPGEAPTLKVTVILEAIKTKQLLVTCDGPFFWGRLEYPLPVAQPTSADRAQGTAVSTRGTRMGKPIAPNSFRVDLPTDCETPIEAHICVCEHDPPAVLSIEWA